MNYNNPRAYTAKFKTYDDNNLLFNISMTSPDAHLWKDDMVKEIVGLLKKNWGSIPRVSVPKNQDGKDRIVLPGTWAFKRKRSPDGSALKYKARYCV